MEDSILDLCRKAKAEQHRTLKEISDATKIPINTVANCFSRKVKSPAYDTIAPICAFLGVSMDRHAAGEGQAVPADTETLHNRDVHIAYLEGRLAQLETVAAEAKLRQRYTTALMILSGVMIVALSAYIAWDYTVKNAGLIQGGNVSVFALVLIAVVVATVAIMVRMLLHIVRSAGGNADEASQG